jgi:imidazolonepropionase
VKVDLLLRRVHLATMEATVGDPYGSVRDGALAVADGRIAWLGQEAALPSGMSADEEIDGAGGWLTPGLIDCHTHLVYAGNRADEFERRLNGESYESIARSGGGIAATVAATRAADEATLCAQSRKRLQTMLAEGVTTVEIKSGYGLDLASERKMLRVARQFAGEGVGVRTSFLGAHAVPPEFKGRTDDYLNLVIDEMLPTLHGEGLIDAVDGFCEDIAFSPAQIRRLLDAATRLGLPVKLHAEQRTDQGGAALVASYRGLSADHLEYLSPAGIAAMAANGTVAALLPGAFYSLRETRQPPVAALRAAGVPLAVATDCNPGTSPLDSPLLAMNMACTLFGLTPAEALAGMTREGARALGLLADRGTLALGKRADLALWAVERPGELAYRMGARPLARRFLGGKQR